ncbi:MAG: hypothetical protein HOW73_00440 [Polyangiaceae bacterium]|nr:hypothetical protein [Polyangiaceae bacterium]
MASTTLRSIVIIGCRIVPPSALGAVVLDRGECGVAAVADEGVVVDIGDIEVAVAVVVVVVVVVVFGKLLDAGCDDVEAFGRLLVTGLVGDDEEVSVVPSTAPPKKLPIHWPQELGENHEPTYSPHDWVVADDALE